MGGLPGYDTNHSSLLRGRLFGCGNEHTGKLEVSVALWPMLCQFKAVVRLGCLHMYDVSLSILNWPH